MSHHGTGRWGPDVFASLVIAGFVSFKRFSRADASTRPGTPFSPELVGPFLLTAIGVLVLARLRRHRPRA